MSAIYADEMLNYPITYPQFPNPQISPEPPRASRRGKWIAAGIAATTLAIGVGIGGLVGRATAPMPAVPAAQSFTHADTDYCAEYIGMNEKLVATHGPRQMESPYLPASQWSAANRETNAKFASYLATWPAGMEHLRHVAANPALTMMLDTQLTEMSKLIAAINGGGYVPADYDHFGGQRAASTALLTACTELTK